MVGSLHRVRRFALVAALSLVVASICGLGVAHVVLAATRINYDDVGMYWIHFYDAGGNELTVSAHFELDSVPAYWKDDSGTWYHCTEPFSESYVTSDLKDPVDAVTYYRDRAHLSQARSEEMVRRLGHCWKWAEANYSGDKAGIAQQLLIWEITFDYGLKGYNYGPGSYLGTYASVERMAVDMSDGTWLDSDDLYGRFMTYYDALADKGRGTGVVMVPANGSPSQKVGRFDVQPSGHAGVTKRSAS